MRFKAVTTVEATSDVATTPGRLNMSGYAAGLFKLPAGATAVAFHAAKTATDTLAAIHNSSDAAVTRTATAAKWVPIPDECFGAAYLGFVLTGAASGTIEFMLGD